MTDLFDLPFEDEPQSTPIDVPFDEPTDAEPPADRRRRPPPRRARRVFTVTELTVRVRDLLESRVRRGLGRGRALELPRLEHRTSLLHAEGRRVADPRRHVPHRRCAI